MVTGSGRDAILGLAPPASGETVLRVDDVSFIEWRPADAFPDGSLQEVDFVRAEQGTVNATLERVAD